MLGLKLAYLVLSRLLLGMAVMWAIWLVLVSLFIVALSASWRHWLDSRTHGGRP